MFPKAFERYSLARMRQLHHQQIPLGTKRAQGSNNPVVQSVCRLGIDTLAIRGRQAQSPGVWHLERLYR